MGQAKRRLEALDEEFGDDDAHGWDLLEQIHEQLHAETLDPDAERKAEQRAEDESWVDPWEIGDWLEH